MQQGDWTVDPADQEVSPGQPATAGAPTAAREQDPETIKALKDALREERAARLGVSLSLTPDEIAALRDVPLDRQEDRAKALAFERLAQQQAQAADPAHQPSLAAPAPTLSEEQQAAITAGTPEPAAETPPTPATQDATEAAFAEAMEQLAAQKGGALSALDVQNLQNEFRIRAGMKPQ